MIDLGKQQSRSPLNRMDFRRGDRLEEERGNDPCSEVSIANQGYASQAESVTRLFISSQTSLKVESVRVAKW